jgi:hypothetical protein
LPFGLNSRYLQQPGLVCGLTAPLHGL